MRRVAAATFVAAMFASPIVLRAQPGETPAPAASASASAAPASTTPTAASDPGFKAQAYQGALATAKLGGAAQGPYTPDEVREKVAEGQEALAAGRIGDVIASMTTLVESPRFSLVMKEPEGRAAYRLLGEAHAMGGAHAVARHYLRKAASGPPKEATTRAAARRLTDLALEDENYEQGISDLAPIVKANEGAQELRGELDYLVGRLAESTGDAEGAKAAYAKIVPLSRFWSSATYRRGVLEVDDKKYVEAEKLFCQVADPKRQDNSAPVFADDRFFAVRDLARLALGRLAHEGGRHDDARYYYYLVPQDSRRLAESLYESATSRYEATDYDGARELLDELMTLGEGHVYDDESHVLDVYVDIAQCRFDNASKKLDAFLGTYVAVRDRAHALAIGPDVEIRAFLERGDRVAGETGKPADVDAKIWRRLEADPALLMILRSRRRLAAQLAGLSTTKTELEGISTVVGAGSGKGGAKPAIDPNQLGPTNEDKAVDARAGLDAIRKELAALEAAGAPKDKIAKLRADLDALSEKVGAAEGEVLAVVDESAPMTGTGLPAMIGADQKQAKLLEAKGKAILADLDAAAIALTRDALKRFDKRSSRLVARARLAKIDVVLGRKKGLEAEVDAIHQGILPKAAVDSLEAARYLEDNEEYWPFEGDEWLDEVIGVEQGER
jgi:hypothetical protein